MVPLRVYVKGFLSYREAAEFDFSDRPLWMLCGDNGAGKSSVFDAITFALFREHRGGGQNATDLINWHGDGFVVECDFQVANDKYRARRTVERNGGTTRLLSRWDGAAWQPLPGSHQ